MSDAAAPRRAPTVVDVADRAGTSRQTVSNVIHGRAHVRAETRKRVLAAIAELGYRPNVTARYLKRQRTTVLGVVVGDLANPFYSEVAAHIERHAAHHGYTMLLASTGGDRKDERTRVESLLEHRVAAIVFLAYSRNRRVIEQADQHTRCVFVGGLPSPHGVFIGVDERKTAAAATAHLVGLGHRRIGYVNTTVSSHPDVDKARLAGYRRALTAAQIDPDDALVVRLGSGLDVPAASLRQALRDLLTAPDRPTAIFAAADYTALQVMDCADSLGLAIPDDLSIVGFDNIALATLKRISLTTVAYPFDELARLSVEAAIGKLRHPLNGNRLLEPELIVRSSTAPPRRSRRRA